MVKCMYEGRERAFEYNVNFRRAGRDNRYAFVERIWAMRRVGYLMDQIQLHGKTTEVSDEIVRLSMKYGIITPYTSFLADETSGPRPVARAGSGRGMVRALRTAEGAEGHVASKIRGELRAAGAGWGGGRAAGADLSAGEAEDARKDAGGSVTASGKMLGYRDADAYEKGKKDERLRRVRQFKKQALYRRGSVWVASKAVELDLVKDKAKIKTIERFSDAYFELVGKNTSEENRILSTQRDGEQMLIVLRGQAYLIK